jgi:hypothetical protein
MSESEAVVIHVRFAPDATVIEIGECPGSLSPQEWFNRLSLTADAGYRALSGGRGVFRIARAGLEALKASGLH